MRGEWERAEQQRGCVDALTEHMQMQTSGAVALTLLLTVLYWCVCVFCVLGTCGDDHDDGNVIWRRATRSRTAVLLAAGRRAGWGGAGRKWMAQAARCRLWQGARARAVGMGGRHGTGRRLAGRVRWRGWRDVEGGRGALRGEWERAEQQRGCVDALTEDMLMQTSGAVALTLLTVLYWCVCVLCVGHMR